MLEVVLGFGFLFNPLGFITPVHGIEVIHFGHVVRLATFDDAFDKAAESWASDPLWGWMAQGKLVSSTTRVMLAPFYQQTPECMREVEWSVVRTANLSTSMSYTIVLSPRVLETDRLQPDLEAAYSKLFQIISMRAQPTSYLFAGCAN